MFDGNGFQANPEGLIEKGKKLSSIFEKLIEQKENVDRIADKVEQTWKGSDSAEYVKSIHSADDAIKELGEVLKKTGDIVYRHGLRLTDSREAIEKSATRL